MSLITNGNANVIVKETDNFRIDAKNNRFVIVSKLSLPYKVLNLTFGDTIELLELLAGVCSEVEALSPVNSDNETEKQIS